MAGMGIALISAHTIAAEVQDGRLAVLDVRGLPIVRKWFAFKRREKRLLPAAQAVWNIWWHTAASSPTEDGRGSLRRGKCCLRWSGEIGQDPVTLELMRRLGLEAI